MALRFFKEIQNQETFPGAAELVAQIGRDAFAVWDYYLKSS